MNIARADHDVAQQAPAELPEKRSFIDTPSPRFRYEAKASRLIQCAGRGSRKLKAPGCLFNERAPRQDVLDLDAGINGKRRHAIGQCLIDGFHGIATTTIDTWRQRP
jgi:hypothetical protein